MALAENDGPNVEGDLDELALGGGSLRTEARAHPAALVHAATPPSGATGGQVPRAPPGGPRHCARRPVSGDVASSLGEARLRAHASEALVSGAHWAGFGRPRPNRGRAPSSIPTGRHGRCDPRARSAPHT